MWYKACSYNEILENSGSGVAWNDSTMLKLDKISAHNKHWNESYWIARFKFPIHGRVFVQNPRYKTSFNHLSDFPEILSLFLFSLLDTPCTYLERYWRVRDLWWQGLNTVMEFIYIILYSQKKTNHVGLGTSKTSMNFNQVFWIHSSEQ